MIGHKNRSGFDGLFITLEGPEGSGKTTQMQLLKSALEAHGAKCIATREPGGTALAEKLREMVKHHQGTEPMTDEAELLLIAAGRAQHVRNLIIPALREGRVVLCDRFFDSTTAYQGYARGIDLDFIRTLNRYASCGCIPDLTILLDISPEEGFDRTASRLENLHGRDRIEAAGIGFHRAVHDGYRRIAEAEPERIQIIPSAGSAEHTATLIKEVVKNALGIL